MFKFWFESRSIVALIQSQNNRNPMSCPAAVEKLISCGSVRVVRYLGPFLVVPVPFEISPCKSHILLLPFMSPLTLF